MGLVLADFNGVVALGDTVGVFSTARHDGGGIGIWVEIYQLVSSYPVTQT